MNTPRKLPDVLYKYMSEARSAIFEDWLIRFSQPKALNDPFEMRPHIAGYSTPEKIRELASRDWEKSVRQEYKNLAQKHTGPSKPIPFSTYRARLEQRRTSEIEAAVAKAPEYNPKMALKIDEAINDHIGVLSLSEHADSLLMWPHYSNDHRGFVIAFDTSAPFFHQAMPPARINPSPEETATFTEEYGRLRYIRYRNERPSVLVDEVTFDVIMTKGEAWEYEAEWRMLMPPDYADVNGYPKQGLPVCLFAVPPAAVKAIILGCNSTDDLLARALKLRNSQKTQHIVIKKARVDERHFCLHFEPVP